MLCFHGQVPDVLRESILRRVTESAEEFMSLTKFHAEAWRRNDFNLANRLYAQMAECMQPSNPVVTIVGGTGSYILVDETRLRCD